MNPNLIFEQIRVPGETIQDRFRLLPQNIFLYGPPGAGKTTVGKLLATRLGRQFIDIDEAIESQRGQPVNTLIREHGEDAFRRLESDVCKYLACQSNLVVASGGGALLDIESRTDTLASSHVILLTAQEHELAERLRSDTPRPLLEGDLEAKLHKLLINRKRVYASFPYQISTSGKSPAEVLGIILEALASHRPARSFTVRSPEPGYEILLGPGLLVDIEALVSRLEVHPPFTVISDVNVGPLYAKEVQSSLHAELIEIEAGERNKNLKTFQESVRQLTALGMERSGTIVALGGGVVGDVAGFTAATFMRGVRWVNLPTSIVAIVDASIGGKVGVDLDSGKNLVGSFHQPDLVLADTDTLDSLPGEEFKAGLAEVIKAGVIADPTLFSWFERSQSSPTSRWLERAIAVKLEIVQEDPYEAGIRAKLNLGHTVGHGLEAASGYTMRHGEAIALGMLIEAQIAEFLCEAEEGISTRIENVLKSWDLPTGFSGISVESVREAMMKDKKKRGGGLRFALPECVGSVQLHENVPDSAIIEAIESRMER